MDFTINNKPTLDQMFQTYEETYANRLNTSSYVGVGRKNSHNPPQPCRGGCEGEGSPWPTLAFERVGCKGPLALRPALL